MLVIKDWASGLQGIITSDEELRTSKSERLKRREGSGRRISGFGVWGNGLTLTKRVRVGPVPQNIKSNIGRVLYFEVQGNSLMLAKRVRARPVPQNPKSKIQ